MFLGSTDFPNFMQKPFFYKNVHEKENPKYENMLRTFILHAVLLNSRTSPVSYCGCAKANGDTCTSFKKTLNYCTFWLQLMFQETTSRYFAT